MSIQPNSSTDVKRSYRSPRRAAQAEATRTAILDAAHDLFLAEGYAGATIRAIARAAGVSDQTVYTGFGDKPSLLVAVSERVVAGESDPDVQGLADLAAELADAPDQPSRTAIAARSMRRTWEHGMLRFESMLLEAAGTDARAAEIAAVMWARKRADTRPLFRLAFPPDQLPDGDDPDASYDLLFAIDSAAFVRILIDDCGWSWDAFEARLTSLLARQFTS